MVCVVCFVLSYSAMEEGNQGIRGSGEGDGGFSWRMNDRGVLTVCLASWMVLWRAGLFIAVLKYLRANAWCLCLMVWMPVILWM